MCASAWISEQGLNDSQDDSYLAPQHLILAVLRDADIKDVLDEHCIQVKSLISVVTQLRSRRVRSQKTEPRFSQLKK